MRILALALLLTFAASGQVNGAKAYERFLDWRKDPATGSLQWEAAIEKYRAKLRSEGLSAADIDKIVTIVEARDEGVLYDKVFADAPKFQTTPNALLVEAIRNRRPRKALDVAMGQGRNSIYLARHGWDVTGFDVSAVGLSQARAQARAAGVTVDAVLASDEEFDFGNERWDLIAILYPIEKRSVHRVRKALKPGGLVVIECSHKEAGNAPFEFGTNELPKIFDGFRILKYEDAVRMHEWAGKELRMVRLIAEKPPA